MSKETSIGNKGVAVEYLIRREDKELLMISVPLFMLAVASVWSETNVIGVFFGGVMMIMSAILYSRWDASKVYVRRTIEKISYKEYMNGRFPQEMENYSTIKPCYDHAIIKKTGGK